MDQKGANPSADTMPVEQVLDLIEYTESKYREGFNQTALMSLCMKGHTELVRSYLKRHPEQLEVTNVFEETPFLFACMGRSANTIRTLAKEYNANIHKRNCNDDNAITVACMYDCGKDALDVLVNELGFELRSTNRFASLLTILCVRGHLDTIRVLIEDFGVDPCKPDRFNNQAIHHAVDSGYTDIAKYLIDQHGIDFETRGEYDQTPLIMAANCGELDMVKYFVNELSADYNAIDEDGRNALAACHNQGHSPHWDIVLWLTFTLPGTMSLRPKGSNHVLKHQKWVKLVNHEKILRTENCNFHVLRKALEVQEQKVVDAIWSLERTRYMLKNSGKEEDKKLFAKLSKPTEEERFQTVYCIQERIFHPLSDSNLTRILCDYV